MIDLKSYINLGLSNRTDSVSDGGLVDLDELKSYLQRHLGDGLVTIVGSGLSCAEGMPGMTELAAHLKTDITPLISGADYDIWTKIVADLDAVGLEAALLKFPPSLTLEALITNATARIMIPAEERILKEAVSGSRVLRLTRLLKHMLKSSSGIPIVTTNYDRLIEFAAEQAGLGVDTMFAGQYCGTLDEEQSRRSFLREVIFKSGRQVHYRFQDRVRLMKPHGSFDWYLSANGPIRHFGSLDAQRLIITPGLNKFRNGYESPFDRHRERANAAIDKATRFLIVGYGFNDDHLETHLKPLINSGKPTILLTHAVSDKGREFTQTGPNFTALEFAEFSGTSGTRVIRGSEETFLPGIHIWDLNGLIDKVFEQ
jgi:hypothetical protein